MSTEITRRRLSTIAGGMVALSASSLRARNALAALPSFTAVEWGGHYIEAAKELAKEWNKASIDWVLYTNGAASLLPKISAQWPHVEYNLVESFDPVFDVMIRQGWLETITIEDVPNLIQVPPGLIKKDAAGNWKTAPVSLSGCFFGYRKDTCPVAIHSIEDLLNPKLRGQICWPSPVQNDNLQMVALALYGGGGEHNMEPGWAFMRKLAKTGNIGVIADTGPAFVNAMTTGQTSVGFFDAGAWNNIAKHFPCQLLTKVPDQPGLKCFLLTEGWCVLKGSEHKNAILDFVNFTLSAPMNQRFNDIVGNPPVNVHAVPAKDVGYMTFTEPELKEYCYQPDWSYLSTRMDSWSRRFETEIIPLMR